MSGVGQQIELFPLLMEAEANVVPRVYAGSADFLFVDDDTRFIRHFQKILPREVVVAALWILTQQLLHGAPAVFEVEILPRCQRALRAGWRGTCSWGRRCA